MYLCVRICPKNILEEIKADIRIRPSTISGYPANSISGPPLVIQDILIMEKYLWPLSLRWGGGKASVTGPLKMVVFLRLP